MTLTLSLSTELGALDYVIPHIVDNGVGMYQWPRRKLRDESAQPHRLRSSTRKE